MKLILHKIFPAAIALGLPLYSLAAVEVVTFDTGIYGGGGALTADPPPEGFFDQFSNAGSFSASFEFERDESAAVGPLPHRFPKYEYFNLTRLTVRFGDMVFEQSFPLDALGRVVGTSEPFGLPGQVWWATSSSVGDISGPTVMGMVPRAVNFTTYTYLSPAQPEVFPSNTAFMTTPTVTFFTVGFNTPNGSNVNVFFESNIPEPTSALLAVGGLMAVGLRMRHAKGR